MQGAFYEKGGRKCGKQGVLLTKKTPQIVKFRELSVENTQCKDLYNLT